MLILVFFLFYSFSVGLEDSGRVFLQGGEDVTNPYWYACRLPVACRRFSRASLWTLALDQSRVRPLVRTHGLSRHWPSLLEIPHLLSLRPVL